MFEKPGAFELKRENEQQMVCERCATVAVPKTITKGAFLIELVLWCAFLVPGLVYSLWRLTTRYEGCPACGGQMIPTYTRKGRASSHPAVLPWRPCTAAVSCWSAAGRWCAALHSAYRNA